MVFIIHQNLNFSVATQQLFNKKVDHYVPIITAIHN